jgi:transcriptional regulator with XRE-family HTH domain
MITGSQIRAARTALRWTAEELGATSGVGARTIKRIEAQDGLPESTITTMAKLKSSLEAAGIEFIGTPDDGPGIRIHARKN